MVKSGWQGRESFSSKEVIAVSVRQEQVILALAAYCFTEAIRLTLFELLPSVYYGLMGL